MSQGSCSLGHSCLHCPPCVALKRLLLPVAHDEQVLLKLMAEQGPEGAAVLIAGLSELMQGGEKCKAMCSMKVL